MEPRHGQSHVSGELMTRHSPSFQLCRQDAVAWLRTLAAESVDLAITDPPYESLEKHRAIGTTTRLKHSKASSNDWFSIFPNSRFEELFAEFWRVLKRNAHLYLYCDPETAFVAKPIAESCGFKFWKPLVWDKKRIGMGYHYRARYEFILFFEKGKRKLADLGIADIIEEPRVLNGYPAEKPVRVSEILIEQSSEGGELVIDPFSGSGSVGVAALKLGRNFQGADLCQEAIDIAGTRMSELGHAAEQATQISRSSKHEAPKRPTARAASTQGNAQGQLEIFAAPANQG